MNERFVLKPIKRVATINDEALGETTDPDFELQYIDIGNVDSNGNVLEIATYRFEAAPSRARRIVRDGDVIISTVRTYLQAIASIKNPPSNLIVSTGFAVVRPSVDKLNVGYCKYALHEPRFIQEVVSRSVGVSYPAITSMELANIPIFVPPIAEQQAIADYLDRETARIDSLIAAKERLLELLAEKRRAVITHAVTRGLNADVSMRDSGVEWFGEIPSHWEVEYARWLFKEIDERSTEHNEEELLSVSHLTGVTSRAEKDVNMFMAESNEGYKICRSGDLVINTLWAWMGAMGIAFQDGIVSPAYNVYRLQEKYIPEYIDLLVRIPIFAQEVIRYSRGVWSSRLRLYPEEFFKVQMPVPPISEQKEIVKHVKSQTDKIDRLSELAKSTIEHLHERRTSLISAVVSGQIKVV